LVSFDFAGVKITNDAMDSNGTFAITGDVSSVLNYMVYTTQAPIPKGAIPALLPQAISLHSWVKALAGISYSSMFHRFYTHFNKKVQ